MGSTKADLILHPARLQILLVLAERAMTTQEIADRLEGVPKSSIYRHIRALLDGGMIVVAETRPVKGVLEKSYRMAQAPFLNQADLNGLTREDHLRYFTMFLASQLQGFADYLTAHPAADFQSDRVGYSEAGLSVTGEELDQVLLAIRQPVIESAVNLPAEGRHRHKIAFIVYPISEGEKNHG